jgi:hypothetical protein
MRATSSWLRNNIVPFSVLLNRAGYYIQLHSHYRGCYNLDENSGLFGAPKSTISVSAADVNAHRGLGTPRTITLQHNQRRGKQAITPFCCLQFLLFAAVLHSVRQQRFG